MGTFRRRIELAATIDGPFEVVEALVDSAATYTLVPASLLRRLGVRIIDQQTFVIADGRQIQRDVGEAAIRIDGRVRSSVVIFGDEASDPLLGAVTLEEFGLGVDPIGQRLIPVPGYLVGFGREPST